MKIVHLTSVHPRYDIRIYQKMCKSLASNEQYNVNLVVADGLGDEKKDNISIYDVGKCNGGRLNRITKIAKKVQQKALELDAEIYHMHDPELIPVGLKLLKKNKKVIFDAHEDLPKQVLSKPYLNKFSARILSTLISLYEKYACKKFTYILTATAYIRDKFLKINKNSIDINNYPILGELARDVEYSSRRDEICYVGGITKIRGISEVVEAMGLTDVAKLNLVGTFSERELENQITKTTGWTNVNQLGQLSREGVAEIMCQSKAGLVTFHPCPNHVHAQPNKIFEYMSAGLPVIASNFQLWKDIVEVNKCGICVDPLNPEEIAEAVDFIITHPETAKEMAKNGRDVVECIYNWKAEEAKLFGIYRSLEL